MSATASSRGLLLLVSFCYLLLSGVCAAIGQSAPADKLVWAYLSEFTFEPAPRPQITVPISAEKSGNGRIEAFRQIVVSGPELGAQYYFNRSQLQEVDVEKGEQPTRRSQQNSVVFFRYEKDSVSNLKTNLSSYSASASGSWLVGSAKANAKTSRRLEESELSTSVTLIATALVQVAESKLGDHWESRYSRPGWVITKLVYGGTIERQASVTFKSSKSRRDFESSMGVSGSYFTFKGDLSMLQRNIEAHAKVNSEIKWSEIVRGGPEPGEPGVVRPDVVASPDADPALKRIFANSKLLQDYFQNSLKVVEATFTWASPSINRAIDGRKELTLADTEELLTLLKVRLISIAKKQTAVFQYAKSPSTDRSLPITELDRIITEIDRLQAEAPVSDEAAQKLIDERINFLRKIANGLYLRVPFNFTRKLSTVLASTVRGPDRFIDHEKKGLIYELRYRADFADLSPSIHSKQRSAFFSFQVALDVAESRGENRQSVSVGGKATDIPVFPQGIRALDYLEELYKEVGPIFWREVGLEADDIPASNRLTNKQRGDQFVGQAGKVELKNTNIDFPGTDVDLDLSRNDDDRGFVRALVNFKIPCNLLVPIALYNPSED